MFEFEVKPSGGGKMEYRWTCSICGAVLTRESKKHHLPRWTERSREKVEQDLQWDAISHLASHIDLLLRG